MTEIVQGTEEWHAARIGKVTGSRIASVTAKATKGAVSASRERIMGELLCERLTGLPFRTFQSEDMKRGTVLEPVARAAYEFMTDASVEQIGFVDHFTIRMAGCSPDGFVGELGLIEIKCPASHNHIDALLGASIDGGYIKQMQWQMACCDRAWCDFVSFDDRLPGEMQLHIERVKRDDALISDLEAEAKKFLSELDDKLSRLQSKYRAEAA